MTIRLATPADLPKIPAIELSGAEAFRGMDVPPELFEDASPVDRWVPVQAAGTLWVAENGVGEIVGFLAGTRHGERLHIDEFDVLLAAQGQGLGRRMLTHVIAWARGAGLASLSLTTFASVPWNGPFYLSCGFEMWTDQLAPDVAEHLADEASRGLTDRCAMRLQL
jgi:GNAT superfamily N-acetyltransferase